MRALIVEKYLRGHWLNGVSYLVQAIDGLASEIFVALPSGAEKSEQFRLYLEPIRDRFNLVPLSWDESMLPPLRNVRRINGMLREVIRSTSADALYLPSADELIDAVNWSNILGDRVSHLISHSEALIMRRPSAYQIRETRMPLWLSNASMKWGKWSRIWTIDPTIAQWLERSCGTRVAVTSRMAPDPVESFPRMSRQAARRKLDLPESGRLVAMVGLIGAFKRPDLLLRAFISSAGLRSDDRLLFAGRCVGDTRELIESVRSANRDRIIVLDRFLASHEELHTVICAADLIAVPSPMMQPSSIAIRAIAAERPVIAHYRGWPGGMVPSFGMGSICDTEDVDAFSRMLPFALETASEFRLTGKAQRLLRYQEPRNFILTWREGLATKLGRADFERPLSWPWVVGEPTSAT